MRLLGSAMATLLATTLLTASSARAAAPVSVYPTAGSSAQLPGAQISFRGIAPSELTAVSVVGSRSGIHTGQIAAHSDNRGGSFLPDKPFAGGETVTVSTGLSLVGAPTGSFQFRVAVPAAPAKLRGLPMVAAGRNGVQRFRSRPDLLPASVTVTKRGAPAALGNIFIAPQFGPLQSGPMLLDPGGNLIWFQPLPPNQFAADFRAQTLFGQPVLTWWQGYQTLAAHAGVGMIVDQHYNPVATVSAAEGVQGMDLHEFLVTDQGQAYIIAVSPLRWPGVTKTLLDSIVQEIDIKTGLVLFEWHALDHVPFSASFFKPTTSDYEFDPYHLNSVSLARDGNLFVSMRNTWADYKINRQTGAVMWTLGSSQSSFKLGPGAGTAFQHDFQIHPDGSFSLFDDGAGPPTVHPVSRAMTLSLNPKTKTVRLVKQYVHTPPLLSSYEGGMQVLPRGEVFVGWGQQPYFSEFNSAAKLDFDAHFTVPTNTYRAYRFGWIGSPQTTPAIAVSAGAKGASTVYTSWNGTTAVGSWRVLAGPGANKLSWAGAAAKRGFETAIPVRSAGPCFQVQALSDSREVLGTTPAVGVGSRACPATAASGR